WIPAYTSRDVVGLDATVDEDAGLDFKWINPTADYVLIQASTDAEHVTFSLYGKKPAWKVQVEQPLISNRVSPDTTPDVQPKTLTQIRDELRKAGWGGGSDQDAVDTYRRLADAAH